MSCFFATGFVFYRKIPCNKSLFSMLTSSPTASIDGVVNDNNRLTVSRLRGAFHTGIIIIIVAGTTSYTECPH